VEVSLIKRILFAAFIIILSGCSEVDNTAFSQVVREGAATYIVDRTGDKWDITQAVTLGFKPERFQYGMGKNAFTPLDDSYLSDSTDSISENLRVIGIEDGTTSKAYSVPRLSHHEISNSTLGDKPVAVGY
jgi:hypothetical protein